MSPEELPQSKRFETKEDNQKQLTRLKASDDCDDYARIEMFESENNLFLVNRGWVSKEDYENAKPENEMNTVMMVEVLENLMNNPYTVNLDKPKFNYDPQNKKEFQVQLPVNYKLKGSKKG